jgi:PAT family beta-lactamase induction signal transducer AmpG
MKLPNLLATRRGRLAAFFFLYMTEGIPLGFTATAIATEMRRQGLGPAAIGAFVGSLYLPWGFKWLVGPFVDSIYSTRLGRRRGWILFTQIMMIVTLLAAMPVDYAANIGLFTAIIFVHNAFAATQDVAIDALAINVLEARERGIANGLMFAGQTLGQAIGGSGVLFLAPVIGFENSFLFVVAMLALVTVFVALPLREEVIAPLVQAGASRLGQAMVQIGGFIKEAGRTFVGSRGPLVALLFAALPTGAMGLGLALQANLAVELGLNDNSIAQLNLWSTLIGAAGCVAGGWFSDRFGRRSMLALFAAATALPTLYLAWVMQRAGWITSIAPDAPGRPSVPAILIIALWVSIMVYSVFNGLMYGVRTALFMDVTNPVVAATQFTAYMAIMNLTISYSASWQGHAIEQWGYPVTLLIDATFGLVSMLLLPLIQARGGRTELPPGAAVPEAARP